MSLPSSSPSFVFSSFHLGSSFLSSRIDKYVPICGFGQDIFLSIRTLFQLSSVIPFGLYLNYRCELLRYCIRKRTRTLAKTLASWKRVVNFQAINTDMFGTPHKPQSVASQGIPLRAI